MNMAEDLLGLANRLISLAHRVGAEEAEVFGVTSRSLNVDLRKDVVEMACESYNRGLGLRAVVNGAVGFSSTSDLSKLEIVAESAAKAARARGKDETWSSLPLCEKLTPPKDVFDSVIDNISPEECLDKSSEMLDGCASVSGVEPSSGGIFCASISELIVNSQGIEFEESSTFMHASLDAVARDKGVASTGYEFESSRSFRANFKEIGLSAAQLAKRSLGGVKGETGVAEVLLMPMAFSELLDYSFVPSICADNVQKGRSSLAGKLGEGIADENLSLIDNGLLKGGMASSSFDGEGVPSQRTSVIEDGVLKGFLYDSYTAGKDMENGLIKSTGNAMRAGYVTVPRVGISNLILASSDTSDLLADTRSGVLVNGVIGAHTANPISGDFSVEAKNVFRVVDGEIEKPLRSLMLAGNIFDLLKHLHVGIDSRAVGSIVTPTIKVEMKVIGG